MNDRRLLVLYSQVPKYFLACLEVFCEKTHATALVIHKSASSDAPYQHSTINRVKLVECKGKFDSDLVNDCLSFNPSAMYVSGWPDKNYLRFARTMKRKQIPIICGSDTHWRGDTRQWLAVLSSRLYLHTAFSHMWVAGERQLKFAQKLGFGGNKSASGIYVADTDSFQCSPTENKRLLFVGRLIPEKSIIELCEAFIALELKDWTLEIVGNGPLINAIPNHPAISVYPFMQPKELAEFAKPGGVFVLPSKYEPWGLVVHEFAAAGYPLLLSNRVGASDLFLENGKNGISFDNQNPDNLKIALKKITSSSDQERLQMGRHSQKLSKLLSHNTWASTLASLVKW